MLDCNRYSVEGLEVRIFPDRELMGRDAAAEAASRAHADPMDPMQLPDGEVLASEFQRFLRQQGT